MQDGVKAGGQKGRQESRPVRQAQKASEKEPIIRKRLPGRKGSRQEDLCKRKAYKRACRQADSYVSTSC